MTKQRRAQILTGMLMAGALGAVLVKNAGWSPGAVAGALPAAIQPKADPTPQDTIYSMFDAARDGDVRGYVDHYTGQMLTSLRQSVAEQGEGNFSRYLKEANAPVKGIAIMEPQGLTDREVKLRVEYVYADRNEVQVFYLEKLGKDWRIARLDSTERIKTLIPYGTPVQ